MNSGSIPTAVERNREPILQVLRKVLSSKAVQLFEIGSGTGQHAVFMAPHFPDLKWTVSDLVENHPYIRQTLALTPISNVFGPVEFEVGGIQPSLDKVDVVFSANTLHIMSQQKVQQLIQHLGSMKNGSVVVFYGPFNYNGQFTSESNAYFDQSLKSVDPLRGIRHFEDIDTWMKE